MPNDPEKQLEEFLASIPEWMRRLFQNGYGALSDREISDCTFDSRVSPLKAEYEAILQRIPAKWKEYRIRPAKYTVDVGARGMREIFRRVSLPPMQWV